MNSENCFKKIYLLIFVLVMMVASAKATPTAYAVYSDGTLTFKYGEKPTNEAFCFDAANTFISPPWDELNSSLINTVIFDSSFSSARPKSCAKWFCEMENLKTIINIEYLNTSNVTYMDYMFYGCKSLTNLDVSEFKTSNVKDMSCMFDGCESLTSLDVSGFNTSNVTDMSYMFSGCESLTSLDVSGFNTSNVTDMSYMFSGCSGLTSLYISGFNTSNVKDMSFMFSGCKSLTSLDVSGFNTSNVTSMYHMFYSCSELTTIYCDDAWSCSDSFDMFYSCLALKGAISYNSSKTDATYANPETGYFTYTKYLTYDLTISGKDVTGENCKDLSTASDLIKGTVSYDPSTKTLYMKNATIEYSGNAISSKIPGLTIKAEGKNVISATKYSALSLGAGTTTITGDSLELHGGTSAIGFIYGTDSHLIIDGMAELTAEGATHGIRGNLNGSSTTELEVKNGATVRAKGATQSISDIDKLTLGAGISLTTPAGAQYKDNGIADASGTAIAGEWVEIGPQKYALWICGKQFTSANSSGITVPNSQGTASYDAETSTLTLNGFGAYTQDSEPMLRSSIDGLVIKVIGTSTLLSTVGTTIEYSGRNLTITGDSLNLISNKEGIYMSNSLMANNLNIQNVKNLYVVSFGAAVKGNVRVLRVNGRTLTGYLTTLNVSGPTSTLEFSSSSPSLCDLNNLNLSDGLSVIVPLEAQFSGHKLCASDGTEATYAYIGKLGDANNDGSVTMADANMVVNYFLSTDKSDIKNFNKKKANINGDGDITMADANQIVNVFLSGGTVKYDPYNGHEYVDLGLSVKWATCNVGAEKPENYGDYFAWGETEKTTSIYGDAWDYYGFCEYVGESENIWDDDGYDVIGNGSGYVFSKYNRTDGKTVLDAEDDAAAVNWGGAWRMPTVDELKELYENCTWEYKEDFNGVSGYKVTSKKTGYTDKYIFLPLAGFIDSICEDAYNDGVEVMLWSSSLVPEAYKLREAYNLRGKKDGSYEVENSFRSTACSVRPVCP